MENVENVEKKNVEEKNIERINIEGEKYWKFQLVRNSLFLL